MSHVNRQDDQDVMTDINMTPLIDVMLVLLIVFILAIPALQTSIALQLPRASARTAHPMADPVKLALDAHGQAYWNGQAVNDAQLRDRAQQAGSRPEPPVVALSGDRHVPYERVLQTLSTLQASGLAKVHFVAQQP